VKGGQAAAEKFVEKVREHLISLDPASEDAKTIPITVKAYAYLQGSALHCVRQGRLVSVGDLAQFWIGFSRSHFLVDFIDVGHGKEEADSKLRRKSSPYQPDP